MTRTQPPFTITSTLAEFPAALEPVTRVRWEDGAPLKLRVISIDVGRATDTRYFDEELGALLGVVALPPEATRDNKRGVRRVLRLALASRVAPRATPHGPPMCIPPGGIPGIRRGAFFGNCAASMPADDRARTIDRANELWQRTQAVEPALRLLHPSVLMGVRMLDTKGYAEPHTLIPVWALPVVLLAMPQAWCDVNNSPAVFSQWVWLMQASPYWGASPVIAWTRKVLETLEGITRTKLISTTPPRTTVVPSFTEAYDAAMAGRPRRPRQAARDAARLYTLPVARARPFVPPPRTVRAFTRHPPAIVEEGEIVRVEERRRSVTPPRRPEPRRRPPRSPPRRRSRSQERRAAPVRRRSRERRWSRSRSRSRERRPARRPAPPPPQPQLTPRQLQDQVERLQSAVDDMFALLRGQRPR